MAGVNVDTDQVAKDILVGSNNLIAPEIKEDIADIQHQADEILLTIEEIKKVVIDWLMEDQQEVKISPNASATSILSQVKASMISQDRRKGVHSLIHKLQQQLLAVLNRSIEIKNIELKGEVLIYDLDDTSLSQHGKFLTYVRGLELSKKDLENDNIRKKTSDFKNLNNVYKSMDAQYDKFKNLTEKSGGGSYIFWRMSSQGKWNKMYVLNRGALAETYMAHFYEGQTKPNYDDNFAPIIPDGYNFFFYQKKSRITKKTNLFHDVTNAPGFLSEDIDLGGGKFVGIKYGTDYNVYKIASILKLLGQLSNDILKDKNNLKQTIQQFDDKLKAGKTASQIIPEIGALVDKKIKNQIPDIIDKVLKTK